MSKTINELRDYLLRHYVDGEGDLYLGGLDFSDFDGDVYISGMKVKGDLQQDYQEVKGDLWQGRQNVEGHLWQSNSTVQGSYNCEGNRVGGSIYADEPTKLLKEVTRKELAEMGFEVID